VPYSTREKTLAYERSRRPRPWNMPKTQRRERKCLTDREFKAIRHLHEHGDGTNLYTLSMAEIARRFGISYSTVREALEITSE